MRFLDPKTDFAFKHIFDSDDSTAALISFINAALELKEGRLVQEVEIRNPYKVNDLPTEKELSGMMEKWAWFLKEIDGLEVRPEALKEPEFDVAFEKVEMGKLSLDEKEAYDVAVQKSRDKRGMIAAARKEGIEKGGEEGMEKGRKEGQVKEQKKIALQMLKANVDGHTIGQCTGLTKKQIEALKNEM